MTVRRDAYLDLVKENEGLKEQLVDHEKYERLLSRDILKLQVDILTAGERERRLREALDKTSRLFHDAKHRLFVAGSYNIEVCTATVCREARTALAAPKEPKG